MESLIFDIDGTLWDSRALVAEGYNLQLHDEGLVGYDTDAEELKTLFGKTMTEIADLLFPDIPQQQRYDLMQRCMDRENAYLAQSPCRVGYEGIVETLESLARDYRLFIVSNCQKGYPELVMEKLGVTRIEAQGQPFDPQKHDAVMHVEDENVGENTVVEVLQQGYQLGDKVLRFAMVKVAN